MKLRSEGENGNTCSFTSVCVENSKPVFFLSGGGGKSFVERAPGEIWQSRGAVITPWHEESDEAGCHCSVLNELLYPPLRFPNEAPPPIFCIYYPRKCKRLRIFFKLINVLWIETIATRPGLIIN